MHRQQALGEGHGMTPITRIEIWMCGYVLGIVTMLIREMGM
ncbi:hypothetical protein [Bilophila wadsworthia]